MSVPPPQCQQYTQNAKWNTWTQKWSYSSVFDIPFCGCSTKDAAVDMRDWICEYENKWGCKEAGTCNI